MCVPVAESDNAAHIVGDVQLCAAVRYSVSAEHICVGGEVAVAVSK